MPPKDPAGSHCVWLLSSRQPVAIQITHLDTGRPGTLALAACADAGCAALSNVRTFAAVPSGTRPPGMASAYASPTGHLQVTFASDAIAQLTLNGLTPSQYPGFVAQ